MLARDIDTFWWKHKSFYKFEKATNCLLLYIFFPYCCHMLMKYLINCKLLTMYDFITFLKFLVLLISLRKLLLYKILDCYKFEYKFDYFPLQISSVRLNWKVWKSTYSFLKSIEFFVSFLKLQLFIDVYNLGYCIF